METSEVKKYEDLMAKHQKFKEIREVSTVVDFDFEIAQGQTLREKSTTLTSTLGQFQFDYVVAGPDTLVLLEIGKSAAKTQTDILFPLNELLLVGTDPKLIKIKNFSV
jgi:hypothetical protein